MVGRLEQQIDAFARAGVVTVHAEATLNLHYALGQIREAGCRAGIALNPVTRADVVEPVADLIAICLCMTVNPGWDGQPYIASSTGARRSGCADRLEGAPST